jgi:hypothetical protein
MDYGLLTDKSSQYDKNTHQEVLYFDFFYVNLHKLLRFGIKNKGFVLFCARLFVSLQAEKAYWPMCHVLG